MKKLLFFIVIIALQSSIINHQSSIVNAQTTPVSEYTFSQSYGTYTEISGGTIHGDETNDIESFNAIDIGFTFNYNDEDYTKISIQTDGYIAMGNTVTNTSSPISSSSGTNEVIAPLGRNMKAQLGAELMSLTQGSAPNRVFTVQWKNYKMSTTNTESSINFQLKLYESSNKIEFIYGDFSIPGYYYAQIGLRGSSKTDFNNRQTDFFKGFYSDFDNSKFGTKYYNRCKITQHVMAMEGFTMKYEEPYFGDFGVVNVSNPDRIINNDSIENIEVDIQNFGKATISSITIKWRINNGSINSYAWSGSLSQGEKAEGVVVGTYDFSGEDYFTLEAWTENPGGIPDENPANDTIKTENAINKYCQKNIVGDYWVNYTNVIIGNMYHLSAGGHEDGFIDYSSHFFASHIPGETVNYEIKKNEGGYSAIWIDYNNDNDFDDTLEFLGLTPTDDFTQTGSFAISPDATEGMHKLRIRFIDGNIQPTADDACTTIDLIGYDADAQDYAINISNPTTKPPCTFNPFPTSGDTNIYRNVTVSWEGVSSTNFDVYFGKESTPPFVLNQKEYSYSPGILDSNTTYYCKIIAKNIIGQASSCQTWSFTTGENVDYCQPTSSCDDWMDYIDDFYMEDIVHENSKCDGINGYSDLTQTSYTTDLVQGTNVSWSAKYTSQAALAIWIDFNDDGSFNETDEFVYNTEIEKGNFVHVENDYFKLPSDCKLGLHRMRVRAIADLSEFTGIEACADFSYGETHDYMVTIVLPTVVPECGINPNPASGAVEQYRNLELSWFARIATSCDVYFGDTTLDYIGKIGSLSFDPDILEPNTTYQWKVVPENIIGQASGCPTWTLRTGENLKYCDEYLYEGDQAGNPCAWGDHLTELAIGDTIFEDIKCTDNYGVIDNTFTDINFERGVNYTWNAKFGGNHQYIAFWMDSNDNGEFEEDEILYTSSEYIAGMSIIDNLTIPASTPLGEHRLRVRLRGGGPNVIHPSQSCAIFKYGQAIDYTAVISEISTAPDCALSPVPENAAVEQILNIEPLSWSCNYATEFDVYFGTDSVPPLVSQSQKTLSYEPGVLLANTVYYWKILPSNIVGKPSNCETWSFRTTDRLEYCIDLHRADEFGEICGWGDDIDDFSLGAFEQLGTGCSNETGYEDFSFYTIDLERGQAHNLSVSTHNGEMNNVGVWIDYNNDGEFNDSSEFVFSTVENIPESFSDTLTIDRDAALGEHRLRIRLISGYLLIGHEACVTFYYGETHDYTVNITDSTLSVRDLSSDNRITIYPNPANNLVTITSDDPINRICVYNILGEIIYTSNKQTKYEIINISGYNNGFYLINIETRNGILNRKLIVKH